MIENLGAVKGRGIIQTAQVEDGNINFLLDENGYAFICMTHVQYAQRFSRMLLEEMKLMFYKECPTAALSVPTDKISSRFLSELSIKYSVPSKFDKVSEAQSKVEEITIKIQDELKKVAGSQNQMADLEVQSHEMTAAAKGFEKSSGEMESMMKWRNCKLCLIIGCVILCILLYIFVPIIIDATK